MIGIRPTHPKVFTRKPTVTDNMRKNAAHFNVNLPLKTMKSLADAIAMTTAPTMELKKKEANTNVNVLRNWNL